MNEVPQNSANVAAKETSERVFKALREARSQLEAIEQARNEQIAIIGMAGRFPGADNISEFWDLLNKGESGIRTLSDEELLAAGVPETTFKDPNYVRAYASFTDPTAFDAQFFGYAPREAELIDPQHRVFLECAWSALEDAGYDSQQYDGTIGVYGGAALNSYLVNLYANPAVRESISPVQAVVNNVVGLMPTRVSYHLDLTGPSCGIQTGCSTSLVAIHTACQSLLHHECDIALAGGVTISSATPQGYTYQAESIASPDGRCRAFDHQGQGTVFGNGVGIVVLKRLQAALSEGDHIYAIVKGSAINNDGADKVNLIAPSVSGQAAVIRSALENAGVDSHTIDYVEAHGTGTPLGDPIEVAALNQAFSTEASSKEPQHCALGSVKTNLGHLDAAAGAAGFIKTVLALQHKTLPASLNYTQPNAKIDFQNGPFAVNQQRTPWPENSSNRNTPKRAGVSSFGMGGTNAHAILEEAPERCQASTARPWQLVMLSAKTPTALDTATQNLATYLQHHPETSIADVAYTLQIGRRAWPHRRFYLCETTADAVAKLKDDSTASVPGTSSAIATTIDKSVVFMFSGQGSQHIDMARGLYETEPTFKQTVDDCAAILTEHGIDLLGMIYPTALSKGKTSAKGKTPEASPSDTLRRTDGAQPALFAIEYALAKLWTSWGIEPQALIGHSIGEYVAACIARIFTLRDALFLIVQRGQLMQRCQPGYMLSVLADLETIKTQLPADAEIAVINGPKNCVVSGPTPVIQKLQQQLEAENIPSHLLATSHAFHSAMMEPALAEFTQALQKITISPPQIDIISNVTGTWLEDAEATSVDYWVRHLRHTVCFSQGVTTLLTLPNPILLEVGPGHTLAKLAQQHVLAHNSAHADKQSNAQVIQSLPHPRESKPDTATLMTALGKLWLAGVPIQWAQVYKGESRHRLSLPTYPFERQSYWVPLSSKTENLSVPQHTTQAKAADMADWFYLPTWRRLPLTAQNITTSDDHWLIFADSTLQQQLKAGFLAANIRPSITWVTPGSHFSYEDTHCTLQPQNSADYQQLIQALSDQQQPPSQVIYGWSVAPLSTDIDAKTDSFSSLLALTQAIAQRNTALTLSVITADIQDVTGQDSLNPDRAKLLGLCQVIPQEYPHIRCRLVDIGLAASAVELLTLQGCCQELTTACNPQQRQIAYRQGQRWVQSYEPLPLHAQPPTILKQNGTYLIAGDLLEGLGMVYAKALKEDFNAKLILLGRSGLPAVEDWEKWLITHSPKHEVSKLIRQLQALGRASEQFLWSSGDLGNVDWVSANVQQGIEQFGAIDGVFHAGVMGDRASCPIEQLNKDEYNRICRSKIKGIQSLQQALANHPVDFYLLQSSLSSVVGGIGFGAYAAANSYLDTLANQQNSTATRWLSLNWDACQLEDTAQNSNSELMALAMSAEEVWQTTQRALAQFGFSQLVISPRSLSDRLEDAFAPAEVISDSQHAIEDPKNSLPASHTRPPLPTAYVAPRNAIEKTVATEMGDLLGIASVGIHDNFFELGGHSLLAIQAVTRLRKEFKVELPMRAFLFEAPTVAGIAQIIQENMPEEVPAVISAETQATLENLLGQIEEMTPEEVENSS